MHKRMIVGALTVMTLVQGCGYNRPGQPAAEVEKQWAQVQNVYQRRADLIPNLVGTVSGAANFEKSTLVEITQARASVGKIDASQVANDPAKFAEFEKAQAGLRQCPGPVAGGPWNAIRVEGQFEFSGASVAIGGHGKSHLCRTWPGTMTSCRNTTRRSRVSRP